MHFDGWCRVQADGLVALHMYELAVFEVGDGLPGLPVTDVGVGSDLGGGQPQIITGHEYVKDGLLCPCRV